jgi:hypothetical protein
MKNDDALFANELGKIGKLGANIGTALRISLQEYTCQIINN